MQNMDFSEAALESAIEHLGPGPKDSFYCLRCSSQVMATAFVVQSRTYVVFWLELSLQFGPDEWELVRYWWENDKHHMVSVRNPGA